MLWLAKVLVLLVGISCTHHAIVIALPNNNVQQKEGAATDSIAKLLASANYLSPRASGQKENEIVMNPSEVIGDENRNSFILWPSSIFAPSTDEAGIEVNLDDDLANDKRATWNSFQGLCLMLLF